VRILRVVLTYLTSTELHENEPDIPFILVNSYMITRTPPSSAMLWGKRSPGVPMNM
jgi:hypothetical protein